MKRLLLLALVMLFSVGHIFATCYIDDGLEEFCIDSEESMQLPLEIMQISEYVDSLEADYLTRVSNIIWDNSIDGTITNKIETSNGILKYNIRRFYNFIDGRRGFCDIRIDVIICLPICERVNPQLDAYNMIPEEIRDQYDLNSGNVTPIHISQPQCYIEVRYGFSNKEGDAAYPVVLRSYECLPPLMMPCEMSQRYPDSSSYKQDSLLITGWLADTLTQDQKDLYGNISSIDYKSKNNTHILYTIVFDCGITININIQYCELPPEVNPIPTMGEWGLVSLGLLIMIVGVGKMKETNPLEASG